MSHFHIYIETLEETRHQIVDTYIHKYKLNIRADIYYSMSSRINGGINSIRNTNTETIRSMINDLNAKL